MVLLLVGFLVSCDTFQNAMPKKLCRDQRMGCVGHLGNAHHVVLHPEPARQLETWVRLALGILQSDDGRP